MGGLRVGGSEKGTVQQGQINKHPLKISESGTIVIDVIAESSGFDPMLELRDPDDKSLGVNDDGGQGLNSRMKVPVAAGSYTILVRGYGSSSGSYRVVVTKEGQGIPGGDESHPSVTEKGNIHPGDVKSGNLAPYESHHYSLKLGKKGMLLIEGNREGETSLDPYLLLMNEQGSIIKQDDDSGGNLNSKIQVFVPEGKFKVVIRGLGSSAGHYSLTVKSVAIRELTAGQPLKGHLAFGEKDYYSLAVSEKGLYDISVYRAEKSALDPSAALYNEGGTLLYKDDDGGGDLNAKVTCYLAQGSYLIQAEGSDAAGGNYSINAGKSTVVVQPHTTISLGQTRSGWLIPEARHVYTMSIEKDTLVFLENRKADLSSLEPFCSLENEQGEALSRDETGGSTQSNSLVIAYLKKGTYKVIASGYGNTSGQYSLSAKSQTSKFIAPGETVNGSIPSGGFEIYRLNIHVDAMLSIGMNKAPGSTIDPYLTLMTGEGKIIARDDDSGGNLNSNIVSFFNKGTYIVMASGLGTSSGSFNLSVKSMEAKKIAPGETKIGTIPPGGQELYTITLKKGGLVTINAEKHNNSPLDPMLTLKSKSGAAIAQDDDGGGNLNARITRFLSAGTYTIVLHGYGGGGGDYQLKVNANFDLQSVHKNISLGQTMTGTISHPEQRDLYSFTVQSFTNIIIRAKKTPGSTIDPFLELLDSGDATIITDDDGATNLNSFISRHLGPGKYTIVVKGFGGSTGPYLLSTMETEADQGKQNDEQ